MAEWTRQEFELVDGWLSDHYYTPAELDGMEQATWDDLVYNAGQLEDEDTQDLQERQTEE